MMDPMGSGGSLEQPDSAARLREFLRILRQHWWIIALCAVVTAGAGYAYSSTKPDQYYAVARLLLTPDDIGGTLTGLSTYQAPDPERESATAIALAEQPVIATRVVDELDLSMSPDEVQARVTAASEGNSSLIAMTAVTDERDLAPRLANEYAREYIEFRRETARAEVTEALQGVEAELETAEGLNQAARVRELRDRRNQLETYSGLLTGGVQLIQPATGQGTLIASNPIRTGILGLVLGLLLGVGLAFLRERLDPRLKREDDVAGILPGVPVIAAIPSWRRRAGQRQQSEGFRGLQTTLSFLDPDRTVHSILITSATMGEGKTTTSINLALAIAEREESVLVLEGDLRRHGLSTRLNLDDQPGVSEILRGDATIEETAVRVWPRETTEGDWPWEGDAGKAGSSATLTGARTGTVEAVPAGRARENPHRLLTSDRVRRLLSEATSAADKVVIDGTPLGLLNDMLPVAGRADAVVVVVHLYYTRRNELKKLSAQLAHAGIKPFGLVLFGVETDSSYDAYTRAR